MQDFQLAGPLTVIEGELADAVEVSDGDEADAARNRRFESDGGGLDSRMIVGLPPGVLQLEKRHALQKAAACSIGSWLALGQAVCEMRAIRILKRKAGVDVRHGGSLRIRSFNRTLGFSDRDIAIFYLNIDISAGEEYKELQ